MNRYSELLAWLILILTFSGIFGQESPEVIQAYRNDPYGNAVLRKKGIMDGNLIRTMYYNQAEIGRWPEQPSGEWPKGTGHSYLDGVCMLVGAKVVVNIGGIQDTITPMEAQYQSGVKERGATLSVGQKQLLAFARALAYDPQILIWMTRPPI